MRTRKQPLPLLNHEKLEPRQMLATVAIQSGNWNDPFTWDNGIPDATQRAIISQSVAVTLDDASQVADEIVIHGILNVAEDATPKTLTADWIHVNSGGIFQIGTVNNRFDSSEFTLTLTGSDITADHVIETTTGMINVDNNDGFLMTSSGGQLQFFGDEKLTFTKLAATVEANSNEITVENVIERNFDGTTSPASDGTLDWEVGDQIVIASSSYDYAEEEVRTITGVTDNGTTTTLTLDSQLNDRHYGEIETYNNTTRSWDIDLRAEVAVLNRSITIQGIQDTDSQFGDRANYGTGAGQNVGIGAHAMVTNGSGQITIDGVRFDRMGQTAQLGRYPMHWHVAGDRTGDIMRNSSVTNSNNRGVTIHGSQGVLLEGNVLHDIHGHGFFMEDAAETDNQFLNNITFGIHKVGGANGNNHNIDDPFIVPGITRGPDGKVNGTAPQSANVESSHDIGQNLANRFQHSSAYWITNPDNTWIGNISAGSEGSGFWFALPDRVLGLSKDTGLYDSLNPLTTQVLQFDYNTSHSAPVGLTFDRGSDIRGGGSNFYSPPQAMQINYYTGYKHIGTAVYHRAGKGIFNESRFADNSTSSFNTFSQHEQNVLFVGHSQGNADPATLVGGFRLYDGPGRIINSHFAGFAASNAHTFVVEGGANKHALTSATGISFEDDGTADHLSIDHLSQPAWTINNSPQFMAVRPDSIAGVVLDLDGSLTGHVGGGPGFVLTPKLDFYFESGDLAPTGWNAYATDHRFAQFKIGINDNDNLEVQHVGAEQGEYIPEFRIENGDGNAILANRWNLTYVQRMYVKLNAGDYTIEFQNTFPEDQTGFDIMLQTRSYGQTSDSAVFRFIDVGKTFKPAIGIEVDTIEALRAATENSFLRDLNGDLWIKFFAASLNGPEPVTIPINIDSTNLVENTNDSGPGSLREAILAANANPGLDVIEFAIPGLGHSQTITPLTTLPVITDRVIFDGLSQSIMPFLESGFESPQQPNNQWKQASGAGSGTLAGSQWTITGGAGITRNFSTFQNGLNVPAPVGRQHALIQSTGSFTQTISGLEIGREYELSLLTMARQSLNFGNNLKITLDAGLKSELVVLDLSEVTFDSFTKVTSQTFIANNSTYSITISADRNGGGLLGDRTTFLDDVQLRQVSGPRLPNSIVLDGSLVAQGNGLEFQAPSIVRYVTVNNFAAGAGIHLGGSGQSIVEFVWSGISADGTMAAGNEFGIRIESDTNTIRSNVLSGNLQDGIRVQSDGITTSDNNVIAGNLVGTDPSGTAATPNGSDGVELDSATGTILFFNAIAFNGQKGVAVLGNDAIGNVIRANSIHHNEVLGIDLGNDGITSNDHLDADNGPNELTNSPTMIKATAGGLTNTKIQGGMNGMPNTAYTVDFYWNDDLNVSGNGEGQIFLTTKIVTTDSKGRAKFSFTGTVLRGKFITAMATDPSGNSSEFSAAIEVKPVHPNARNRGLQSPLGGFGDLAQVTPDAIETRLKAAKAKSRIDVKVGSSKVEPEKADSSTLEFKKVVSPTVDFSFDFSVDREANLEVKSESSQMLTMLSPKTELLDNFFESF